MNRPLKILIVEDVLTDAELIVMELEGAGLHIDHSRSDNKTAYLAYLSDHKPDAIISDYALPGFNAIEALKIRNKQHHDVPFILVTGNQTEEIAVDCIKEGADDYILKSSLIRLPSALLNAIERKRAESDRERAEERTRFLLESMPQKVWTADKEGRFDYFNARWTQYSGASEQDLLMHGWERLIHPEDLVKDRNIWDEALRSGKNFQNEIRLLNENKEYRWHLTTGVVQKDREGNILMWVGTTTDIHDMKMIQEDLLQSRKKLQDKNEEFRINNEQLQKTNNDLDNFVYTASHDLKAPISNIEGLISALHDSLRQGSGFEEVEMIFEMIEKSLFRFKNTITDLTEISKVQKETENTREEISLTDIIEDVTFLIKDQIKACNAEIEIDITACPSISFSRKNLKSIFYNLLSNAIKYRSPERCPRIHITTECRENHIVLSVKDNGLGFSSEGKAKAFTMFKRFHNHVEGSGIGLYIVKRIMDNDGGRVELHSEPDRGSEFRIFFKRVLDPRIIANHIEKQQV